MRALRDRKRQNAVSPRMVAALELTAFTTAFTFTSISDAIC
jgi:hypothetical protein